MSGGVVGLLCGVLGTWLAHQIPTPLTALRFGTAGIGIAYGIAAACGARWPVPTRRWQVPRRWARYGHINFAAAFGAILGAGLFTVVNFIGFYLLLAVCVLSADPLTGSATMALYGAARAIPIPLVPLIFWARGGRYSPEATTAVARWLRAWEAPLSPLRTATLMAIAVSLLA